MSPKRNTADHTHFKPSSQRLARMHCGPSKGKGCCGFEFCESLIYYVSSVDGGRVSATCLRNSRRSILLAAERGSSGMNT